MITYHEILEANNNKNRNYKKIKIIFLSNFNNKILKDYITYQLKKNYLNTNFFNDEYDQIEQELSNSKKKFVNYDYLILAYDLNSKFFLNDSFIKNYIQNIIFIIRNIQVSKYYKNLNIIFFNLFPTQSIDYLTSSENIKITKLIQSFNKFLNNIETTSKNVKILDVCKIICETGVNNYYDLRNNYILKSPYSEIANNHISSQISKIIYKSFNINKKCLVLDLDNTLWGGILGEIGAYEIDLDKTYNGECFLRFQRYLKLLKKRGVILAIASKNNFKDVQECFELNKKMILKLKDFSSIKINWDEKYKNIDLISKELNIGKDSIVFFDDSSFEREQMRSFNKEVNVIDVPNSPEEFINTINQSNFFVENTTTKEDKKKNFQYKILKNAEIYKKKFNKISDFYKNLKMELVISKIDKSNFDRSLQLINKTNQFNLTNRRYTAITLEKLLLNKSKYTFLGKLKDKFGDHGITALCIIKKIKKNWFIDNFLLSCRILGRKIEILFLYEILSYLKAKKIKTVYGFYKKSNKNIQCKNFFSEIGFKKIGKFYIYDLKKLKKLNEKTAIVKYAKI